MKSTSKRKRLTARPASSIAEPVDAEAIEELRHMVVREIFESAPPSPEAVSEVVRKLESLPPASTSRLLQSLAVQDGEKTLPLLERMAQSQTPSSALAAVEALGSVRSKSAADLLARVASTDPSGEMRKQAKRSLFRLRSLGVAAEMPAARPVEVRARYRVLRAILGSFDGAGTRPVIFAVERPFGGADRIAVLLNTRLGLTHCAGMDMSSRAVVESLEEMIRKSDSSMLMADAPVSYCQHLVRVALTLNPKTGTPIPRGYYRWKDELGKPAEEYDRPLVYRELHSLEIKWDPTLLEQSGQLLNVKEFDSWAFDLEQVRPLFFELQQMQHSAITLTGWSQKERQEALLRAFFDKAINPEEESRYKYQLEEMAYLFLRHERRLDARRALAAAIAMGELHGGDLVRVPFMRDLLTKSLALVERELRGGPRLSPEDLGIITPDQFLQQ